MLKIADLQVAPELFEQYQRFTITAQNYAEFKAMRPLRSMEQITDVTIRTDRDRRLGHLSVFYVGLSLYFEKLVRQYQHSYLHNRASNVEFDNIGVHLAKVLTSAASYGNRGPTTLIMAIECCEPFMPYDVSRLEERFFFIDRALDLPGVHRLESGGKVLKFIWLNEARLTWAASYSSPYFHEPGFKSSLDRKTRSPSDGLCKKLAAC
ncbi:hypothetical protein BKA65DRAFT_596215 [Rhexocercosporidium sp. MPI-PUGE-AT-0058]|nr:hypothetical protein BKA65DRAFT_596215 [Rhexocercosporidium sp. MPI-PUGE-AT-0058]